MKLFYFFLLVFAAFSSKSVAQTELIELGSPQIWGGKGVLQGSSVVVSSPSFASFSLPLGVGCGFDVAQIAALPVGSSCTVTPENNSNPTNGVSTFDMVLISKHILNSQPFTSPWQYIAADINKSGHVSTADIVDLRKLILAINSTIPNNTSWRFFSENCVFPAPPIVGNGACVSSIPCSQALTAENDFIAVKIGDINGNFSGDCFWSPPTDDRSGFEPFLIETADRFLDEGEVFEVVFSLKNGNENAVAAQFTLEHDGLQMLEILNEKGLKPENFGLFPAEKMLTASWISGDGAPVFALKMKAEKAGRLRDFLKISDRLTRAEGYTIDGQPHVLNLQFSAITITQTLFEACSTTDNDPDGNAPQARNRHAMLWNNATFNDPKCQNHDLNEGVKSLGIEVVSPCGAAGLTANFELKLDLDGDDLVDSTILSASPKMRFGIGEEWVTDNSSSLLSTISNGQNEPVLQISDGSAATPAQIAGAVKKRFFVTRDPEWDAAFSLAGDRFLKDVDLPFGKHQIKWTVADGCGATETATFSVEIKDCKKPSIICKPLAGPIMNGPTAMVTVWASDWVEYAEDNACLEAGWFSVRKEGAAGFGSGVPPLTAAGGPVVSVKFDCNDGSANGFTQVEIWTKDKAGNYDYCVSYIQLNKQGCGPLTPPTVCEIRTQPAFGSQCIELVEVSVSGSAPGLPSPILSSGFCGFDIGLIPIGGDYIFKPKKLTNPTNGVSTFDLVLMSKHILGSQVFDTPYKWIAADVNRSGHVSTADIVDMRKVVLGLLPNFPNNDSWRFAREDHQFTSTNPAGELFLETITVPQFLASAKKGFIGMKIGDINGNANPAQISGEIAEDRSPLNPFSLRFEDRFLEKNEVAEVAFSFENKSENAAGIQFTIEHDGLEITGVLNQNGSKSDFFGLFPTENLLTGSWIETDGAPFFKVKMRAEKAGRLSDFLKLSDRKTPSVGYSSDGAAHVLNLDFFEKSENDGFQLFQNQPNPFLEATQIRFVLSEKEAVRFEVFDATARLVFSKKMMGEKGLNAFELSKNEVGAAGFLTLKMTTAGGAAARKMMLR